MDVQVLIATMNQTDHSLPEKMNIQTDALVGNQNGTFSVEEFDFKDNKIVYFNSNEVGVGLNRNTTLMRASGDICLFADDDMVYVDGYADIIADAFRRHPDADVIVFNIKGRSYIKTSSRVNVFNFLRYGTARIAFRLNRIRENGIFFNLCFGGGTPHSHGEDNLFLSDCLKKGLKVYAEPILVAELINDR